MLARLNCNNWYLILYKTGFIFDFKITGGALVLSGINHYKWRIDNYI
jgi:hypothetical protein